MARCSRCGIEGPFVRTDEKGLCALCRLRENRPETVRRKKVISPTSLDPDAVLTRYLTSDHADYPSEYDVTEYYLAEFDCILASLRMEPLFRAVCDAESARPECVYLRKFDGCLLPDCADFVAVDTETSSLGSGAEIVEISAVRFEQFRPVSAWSSLCRPWGGISPQATAIHGITEDDVVRAPRFAELIPSLDGYFGGKPLVAHNAAFDLSMLASEGFPTHGRQVFDTLGLARRILRDREGNKLKSYKLSAACRACAILFSGAHRSTADALACGLLFNELVKRQFRTPSLPSVERRQ